MLTISAHYGKCHIQKFIIRSAAVNADRSNRWSQSLYHTTPYRNWMHIVLIKAEQNAMEYCNLLLCRARENERRGSRLFTNSCSHSKIIQSVVIVFLFHPNFRFELFSSRWCSAFFSLHANSLGFSMLWEGERERNVSLEHNIKCIKNCYEFSSDPTQMYEARTMECIVNVRELEKNRTNFLILPFKNIIIMYLILLLPNHLISLWKCRRTSLCRFFFSLVLVVVMARTNEDQRCFIVFNIRYVGYR